MLKVSCSSCAHFDSALFNILNAKAISFSSPFGITCEITAPTPYRDTSQASCSASDGLK